MGTDSAQVDVAGIAAGLTKAQRSAMLDDLLALRSGVARVRKQLFAKGLVFVGGVASPLGLEVRALLERKPHVGK